MHKAAWILVFFAGAAAAQQPYRLGNEEAARRLLFCAAVYEDTVAMHGNPGIKENATKNAARANAAAAKLATGNTHALLARIAKDSFLEQIDGAKRTGGVGEHYKALSEFQADCSKILEQYAN